MNQESWKCPKESTVLACVANAFHSNITALISSRPGNVFAETNQKDWEWITIAEQRQGTCKWSIWVSECNECAKTDDDPTKKEDSILLHTTPDQQFRFHDDLPLPSNQHTSQKNWPN